MKKEVKYLIIGFAVGAGLAGMFIPFGDEDKSLFNKLTNKED